MSSSEVDSIEKGWVVMMKLSLRIVLGMCLALAGCKSMDQMMYGIQTSSEKISDNTKAVQASTAAVQANESVVRGSSESIKANGAAIAASTAAITDNAKAIALSTAAIHANADAITASTADITANGRAIEQSTAAIAANAESIKTVTDLMAKLQSRNPLVMIGAGIVVLLLVMPSILMLILIRRIGRTPAKLSDKK